MTKVSNQSYQLIKSFTKQVTLMKNTSTSRKCEENGISFCGKSRFIIIKLEHMNLFDASNIFHKIVLHFISVTCYQKIQIPLAIFREIKFDGFEVSLTRNCQNGSFLKKKSKVGNTDVPLLFQNKDFDKESTNSEKEDLEDENDEDENSDVAESTTINNPNATAKSKKPSKTFKKNLSKSISQLQTLKQKSGKNALKAKRATKFSKKGTTKSKRAKFYHPKKKTD